MAQNQTSELAEVSSNWCDLGELADDDVGLRKSSWHDPRLSFHGSSAREFSICCERSIRMPGRTTLKRKKETKKQVVARQVRRIQRGQHTGEDCFVQTARCQKSAGKRPAVTPTFPRAYGLVRDSEKRQRRAMVQSNKFEVITEECSSGNRSKSSRPDAAVRRKFVGSEDILVTRTNLHEDPTR
ncbi:uncharacterized protein LOC143214407 [Lasioglossum baleicum]|uniref:uncharacterized protein LOC143214407 n=1 Tax=Lasioglossum baleicum TaxID=434251 RepID=UPI003FCD45A4